MISRSPETLVGWILEKNTRLVASAKVSLPVATNQKSEFTLSDKITLPLEGQVIRDKTYNAVIIHTRGLGNLPGNVKILRR